MTFESIDNGGDAPEPAAHPCTGCGAMAPGHLFACRNCTATLPLRLRRAANRAHRQGGPAAPLQAATQYLARTAPAAAETPAVAAHLDRITR